MGGPWEKFQDSGPSRQPASGPWDKFASKEDPGILSEIANKIDSYGGSPTRTGILAGLKGDNPLSAAAHQFGEDPSKGASGKDIAVQLGVPDEEQLIRTAGDQEAFDALHNKGWAASMKQAGVKQKDVTANPAEGTGFLIEAAADPLNFIPASAVEKAAGFLPRLTKGLRGAQEVGAVQSQLAKAAGEASSLAKAEISGGDLTVEQSGKLFDVKAPQSLDELREWKPDANRGDAVGVQRLGEIENIVPDLKTKPLKYHYDMMENPKAMKELKLKFENLPTDDAKKIAAYNQQIVNESGQKLRQTINDLSGGVDPKKLTDAGYDFISAVKDKYGAEKGALGPLFENIKKSAAPITSEESRDLAIHIGENSKLGKVLSENPETGRLFLEKNSPKTGISDSEHGILSRVVDDLNDGMSFKEMQDTRDFLRKSIDPANPAASEEISKVRSILLGQMENMASKRGPGVGDTFKAYAKNERTREAIENIIGGKIESLDAMFAANPDKVVQKIFSNPNYAKTVGEYVGPQKMQELTGSYLNNGLKKAFDPATGFNPSTARNWIKSNSAFLSSYLDPRASQRLSALADYGYYGKRFLDEVNPSGTAASLLSAIEPKGFLQSVKQKGITGAISSEVSSKISSSLNQKQAIKALNEALGQEVTAPLKLKDVTDKIPDALKDPRTYGLISKAGLLKNRAERDRAQ